MAITIDYKPKIAPSERRDMLNINKHKRKITAALGIMRFRDKDTRQVVMCVPALDITGYGSTDAKAKEMLEFSLDEYFKFLLNMSAKNMEAELESHGWKQKNKFAKKEFSKAYIDKDGKLRDFNAVADEVEEGILAY